MLQVVRRVLARRPALRDQMLAILDGAMGDRLHEAQSPMARPMALFVRDVESRELRELEWSGLRGIDPGPRALLLVHGLMGSPRAWAWGTVDAPEADPGARRASEARAELGQALGDALGVSALYLRYNSGRHVSDNGRELAERLEGLCAAWPEPLERLDVIAHSMGGLVIRSALHYGLEAGHAWPEAMRRVVLLGTPSHGAPLEQLAHVAAFTLETIWNPWTKLVGKAINLRSSGIKDLRHGFCRDEDWRHKDQDVLRLQRPRPTRSPAHVRWFVAAGIQGSPDHWVSSVVGDGLVRASSARGHGFGTAAPGVLPEAEVKVFGRTGHMALMNDPEVRRQVLRWLGAEG